VRDISAGVSPRSRRSSSPSTSSSPLAGLRQAIGEAWREAWTSPAFRVHALATPVALAATLTLLGHVLPWVERRQGPVLADPVLAALPAHDTTWLIFALIYAGLIVAVARVVPRPRALVVGVQAYVAMLLLRMVAMALTPLGAPAGMIALRDPFAEFFTSTQLLTKDLFFSGHTATMFLLFLAVPGREVKALFLFCTVTVGGALLFQHVHYAIDVLAAPPFAYAAFRLASRLHRA
jgi:hypothetical protein